MGIGVQGAFLAAPVLTDPKIRVSASYCVNITIAPITASNPAKKYFAR